MVQKKIRVKLAQKMPSKLQKIKALSKKRLVFQKLQPERDKARAENRSNREQQVGKRWESMTRGLLPPAITCKKLNHRLTSAPAPDAPSWKKTMASCVNLGLTNSIRDWDLSNNN
jgi:hypothetical protein